MRETEGQREKEKEILPGHPFQKGCSCRLFCTATSHQGERERARQRAREPERDRERKTKRKRE